VSSIQSQLDELAGATPKESPSCSRVKLPRIELPTFDGKNLDQWPQFADHFLALMKESNINNLDKFKFLNFLRPRIRLLNWQCPMRRLF
jgi:hypothetical protein